MYDERLNEGTRQIHGGVPFSVLVGEYLQWARRQRSFKSKAGFIRALVRHFGDPELRAFTTQGVERFQSAGRAAGRSPATVNRHVATLKHMFTKAVEWELVSPATREKVRRVRLLEESNRRLRFLSREEAAALVEASTPHLRPIVLCALHTGLRRGEIFGLEWERHVDLKHGFLLLDVTKNGERREVPINATLSGVLQGQVRRIDSPFVFHDGRGRRLTDVKRSFRSACRRAGLKDFRFHDLRHTFASWLVMGGVDLTTVSRLLGHKSLTMTLRYAHLAQSHKAAAVAVLDGHDSVTWKRGTGFAGPATP